MSADRVRKPQATPADSTAPSVIAAQPQPAILPPHTGVDLFFKRVAWLGTVVTKGSYHRVGAERTQRGLALGPVTFVTQTPRWRGSRCRLDLRLTWKISFGSTQGGGQTAAWPPPAASKVLMTLQLPRPLWNPNRVVTCQDIFP